MIEPIAPTSPQSVALASHGTSSSNALDFTVLAQEFDKVISQHKSSVATSGLSQTRETVNGQIQLLLVEQMLAEMLPKEAGGFFGSDVPSDHYRSLMIQQLANVISPQLDILPAAHQAQAELK